MHMLMNYEPVCYNVSSSHVCTVYQINDIFANFTAPVTNKVVNERCGSILHSLLVPNGVREQEMYINLISKGLLLQFLFRTLSVHL